MVNHLSDDAKHELTQTIERLGGEVVSMDNPTTTLEELFLRIIEDSAARPGRRVVHRDEPSAAGDSGDDASPRDDG